MTEENKSLQTPQNEPEPEAEPVDTAAAMQYFEASEAAAEVGREILASRKPKKQKQKKPKKKRVLYSRDPKLPPPRNPSRNRRSSPLRKRRKPTAGSPPSGRNPPRSRQPSRPLPNPRNPRNPRSQRPPRSRRKRRKNPGRSRGRKPPPRQRMQSPGKNAPLWRNPSEHGARLRLHRYAAAAGILRHSPGHRSCVRPCPGPGAHPVAEPAL